MKKIVLLLVAALVLSCSKNDCNCKEEKMIHLNQYF